MMRYEDPPVQISLTGVSRRLGQARTLPNRVKSGYLPNTKKYLDGVTETREEFAMRRLRSVISSFIQKQELPTVTSFLSAARVKPEAYSGLAKNAYKVLEDHLENQEHLPQQWRTSGPEN